MPPFFATCRLQKLNYQKFRQMLYSDKVLFMCEALKISTGKVLIKAWYKFKKKP